MVLWSNKVASQKMTLLLLAIAFSILLFVSWKCIWNSCILLYMCDSFSKITFFFFIPLFLNSFEIVLALTFEGIESLQYSSTFLKWMTTESPKIFFCTNLIKSINYLLLINIVFIVCLFNFKVIESLLLLFILFHLFATVVVDSICRKAIHKVCYSGAWQVL